MSTVSPAATNCLLIYSEEAAQYLEVVQQHALLGLRALATDDLAQARRWFGECNIVLSEPHTIGPYLQELQHLEWLQSTFVGVGPLLEPVCRKDYALTTLGGLYAPLMTEYVFCYLLAHAKRAWQRYQAQLQRRWDNTLTGALDGKVLGLAGVGVIGAQVARTAKYFGMRTKGLTRSSTSCPYIDAYFHSDQLLEFVSDVDYLVCALPDTAETRQIIGRQVLRAMPRRAVLVNIGRGNALDDEALVEALRTGTIASAVLDVFREEPLPASHPFWITPNLIITCHSAAPSPGYHQGIVAVFAENYRRFITRQPLLSRVDFERGY
jgi:phosphoglycerate dehydrogenase-like enzyme